MPEEHRFIIRRDAIDTHLRVGGDGCNTQGYTLQIIVTCIDLSRLHGERVTHRGVVHQTRLNKVVSHFCAGHVIHAALCIHQFSIHIHGSLRRIERYTYATELLVQLRDLDCPLRCRAEIAGCVLPSVITCSTTLDAVVAPGQFHIDTVASAHLTVHPDLRLIFRCGDGERSESRGHNRTDGVLSFVYNLNRCLISLIAIFLDDDTVISRFQFQQTVLLVFLAVYTYGITARRIHRHSHLTVVILHPNRVRIRFAAEYMYRLRFCFVQLCSHDELMRTDRQFCEVRTTPTLHRRSAVDRNRERYLIAVDIHFLRQRGLLRQTGREFGTVHVSAFQRHAVVLELRTVIATDGHLLHIRTHPNPYFIIFVLTLLDLLRTEVKTEQVRYRCLKSDQRTTFTVLVIDLRPALRQVLDIVRQRCRCNTVLCPNKIQAA